MSSAFFERKETSQKGKDSGRLGKGTSWPKANQRQRTVGTRLSTWKLQRLRDQNLGYRWKIDIWLQDLQEKMPFSKKKRSVYSSALQSTWVGNDHDASSGVGWKVFVRRLYPTLIISASTTVCCRTGKSSEQEIAKEWDDDRYQYSRRSSHHFLILLADRAGESGGALRVESHLRMYVLMWELNMIECCSAEGVTYRVTLSYRMRAGKTLPVSVHLLRDGEVATVTVTLVNVVSKAVIASAPSQQVRGGGKRKFFLCRS